MCTVRGVDAEKRNTCSQRCCSPLSSVHTDDDKHEQRGHGGVTCCTTRGIPFCTTRGLHAVQHVGLHAVHHGGLHAVHHGGLYAVHHEGYMLCNTWV